MDEKTLSQGISFTNKRNWDKDEEKKKPNEELPPPPEPKDRSEDIAQLLRQERLGEKHTRAKIYNASGAVFNVGGIIALGTSAYAVIGDPSSAVYFDLLNKLGFPYSQEQVVLFIEEWKAHLIGLMASFQTFLAWWQHLCKEMKLNDVESVFQAINDQCGKMLNDFSQ